METLTGQTLGQYRILEQIGKGGMATVFKAYQPGLDRFVAIKILPAYYAHEEGFSERFAREARAIARLDHPHILPVYDFGQVDGLSYIVMKYVATGTLKDRLGQPLRAREVLDILKQIALALDHAHEQGVLHRDVKPSNILVDAQGWIYLSDFGLAKMVEGSVQLTASGVGVGTPAYMSPEQGQGLPVDARTDVYALGIILYEMLTGRVPYEAETPMAVVVKHITSPLPLPRTLNPDIPGSVERVVLKALAKDPNDRYHRAGELVAALETATRQTEPAVEKAARPSSVSPAPGPSRQAQPAPVSPAAVPRPPAARPAPHPASQPARESNLPVLAMAGLAGVILVVAIALVVVVLLLLRRGVASDQLAGSGPDAAAVTFVPAAATLAVATLSPVATPGPPTPAPIETAPLQPTQVPVQAPPSSHTPASTDTPSPTHTPVSTDSPSPTFTPVATDTPSPTSTPVATHTPSPTFTPPPYLNPDTGYLPDAVFNSMWAGLGGGSSALGYPTGPAVADRNYSKQYFERGYMYWWQAPAGAEPIWVVVIPDPTRNSGATWMRYDNAWDASQPLFPANCPEAAEPLGPMAGFGVTWCDSPAVKEQVGRPQEREAGSADVFSKGAVQFFQHGVMLESPGDRQIWALIEDVGWRRARY